MKRLEKLNHAHKAACRMRIEGKTNEEICKELRISKVTLHKWFSDDLVKEYIQDLAENVEQAFAEKLATGGMIALQALTDLVQKDDADTTIPAGTKVQVAREILDRLPGTARVVDRHLPAGPGGDTNYMAVFANMTDDDLANFIANWNNAGDPARRAIDATATEA